MSLGTISTHIQYISTVATRAAADRVDDLPKVAEDIKDVLYDGKTPVDRVLCCKPTGFGHKLKSLPNKTTVRIYSFILYIQGRGDADVGKGSKTLPSEAAAAMQLLVTTRGEKVFSTNSPSHLVFMKANVNDKVWQ